VWDNLANLRLAAGDVAEAERLYRAALARAPGDADAHWNLAIALQRQGRPAEALEHYREGARLDPRLATRMMGSR
jgi:tetratricopeptide (TPR) repeat protein